MELPIDYEKKPFREKYLDETLMFATWFIFGESPDRKTVDIVYFNGDIITTVPREIAIEIIDSRYVFLNTIYKHLCQ